MSSYINQDDQIINEEGYKSLPVVVRYKYAKTDKAITHSVRFDKNDNWHIDPLPVAGEKTEEEEKTEHGTE